VSESSELELELPELSESSELPELSDKPSTLYSLPFEKKTELMKVFVPEHGHFALPLRVPMMDSYQQRAYV
jgi:hypothetical protein